MNYHIWHCPSGSPAFQFQACLTYPRAATPSVCLWETNMFYTQRTKRQAQGALWLPGRQAAESHHSDEKIWLSVLSSCVLTNVVCPTTSLCESPGWWRACILEGSPEARALPKQCCLRSPPHRLQRKRSHSPCRSSVYSIGFSLVARGCICEGCLPPNTLGVRPVL